jgi:hypothetical protein
MVDFDDIPGTIARLPDESVEQFLFDCLERRFGQATMRTSGYTFTFTLPPGYRVLTPTMWIEAEVTNGGISQYFWNRLQDGREMTIDAIDAYEEIGATEQAAALRDCVRAFVLLESECRQLLYHFGADGYFEFTKKWDALDYRGDGPLSDEDGAISKKYRVPWIRENALLFSFDLCAELK